MLLNVISRPGDAFQATRHLLEDNHEPRPRQRRHILRAIAIYRALLASGVVEQLGSPDVEGRRVRLVGDLQLDFALNQPLSPFALASFELLDKESPTYAMDMLSIVEATLDDPRQVLYAQQGKAKGEAVALMKAEGIEYEERMVLLEEVTWPKPLDELLNGALETYRRGAPWVEDATLSPKSVARDMFERSMTFVEYIGHYQLARSEGLVLRYLADAYRALRQTVPDEAKTEELTDVEEWLGELVRQVDSSLLDEWEALAAGAGTGDEVAPPSLESGPPGVTRNVRAFRVLVRNAMFRRVELAALRRWDMLGELDSASGWNGEAWREALLPYWEHHGDTMVAIGTGPDARGPSMITIEEEPERWLVRQVFDDPDGDHDWAITAEVDLAASDEDGNAVVWISTVEPLGGA